MSLRRKRAVYVTDWSDEMFGRKAWSSRYDSLDYAMGRPVHANMTVAPSWAKKLTKRNRYRSTS